MEMIWIGVVGGFVAGVAHVLSGPDHLAAVAPLAAGERHRPWRVGLEWGLGHCAGVLLIGLLALLLREMLPLQSISSWAERSIGILLIGMGVWGGFKLLTNRAKQPPKAAFAIGTVHGLAGSSHLVGVLPGMLFPSPASVCAYFTSFAAGTLAAMAAFSMAFGSLPQRLYRAALAGSSLAAVVIGCYWLIA